MNWENLQIMHFITYSFLTLEIWYRRETYAVMNVRYGVQA